MACRGILIPMARYRLFSTDEKRRSTEKKRLDEKLAKMKAARNKPKRQLSDMDREVREMATAFEDALEMYSGGYKRVFPRCITQEIKSYKTLQRAVEFAKELKVDCGTYIKGLFYVSDMWGNRAPKVQELSDYKTKVTAKDRVSMYLEATKSGTTKSEKNIVGLLQPVVHVPQTVKSRNSERQLKAFMSNFGMTEEEVLKKYAIEVDSLYFDRKWLLSLPTYVQLLEEAR